MKNIKILGTGCAKCAVKCPFDAIAMVRRSPAG